MLLLLLLVCTAVASASDLRLLAWAFVAGAALTTLLPLAGVAAGTDEGGRFGGDLGNPNNLAAVVLPALALVGFMLVAARGRGERLLLAAAGAVLIVAFVRTESRGGLVGLGVMAVAAIALAGPARRRVLAALLLLCGAVALWFAAIAPGDARSRATDFSTAHSTGRVDLWHVAERMAANHPLGGIGIDNFTALEPTYLPSELDVARADLVLRGTLIHNTYLNLLAELGVVGAALFAALVIGALAAALAAIRTLAQRGDRPTELLARGLATGAVGMLAAYVFFSAQYEKQLWIVLGALLALSSVARRRAALRPGGGARSDAVSS
jgi:O-antigen ligase